MGHNSYEMMMSLELDGELSREEQRELRAHLASCSACADTWDRMCQLDLMFLHPAEMSPPANLSTQVMARVGAYEAKRRGQPWVVSVLVISSILAALSVAAPVAFFSLGLQHVASGWPVVGVVIRAVVQTYGFVLSGATLAADALVSWLAFLSEEPAALAVVLSALALASIWIGILEGLKAARAAGASQPSSS